MSTWALNPAQNNLVKKQLDNFINAPTYVPAQERRKARLTSSISLFFSIMAVLMLVFLKLRSPNFNATAYIEFIILPPLLAYCFSRTHLYRIAPFIVVIGFTITIYATIGIYGVQFGNSMLQVLMLPLYLANILLSALARRLVFIGNVIALGLLPLVLPGISVLLPLLVMIALIGLFSVYNRHRDAIERENQAYLIEWLKKSEEANVALTHANELAQDAVRTKSEFLSVMSHELRTPLNAISGFCSIMIEGMGGELDNDALHMIKRIEANSTRLVTLINQVLDISKMEANRLEIVAIPFSPFELAEKWKLQYEGLVTQKGLTFTVLVDPTLPSELLGDVERLTQIATNLLGNAVKFTQNGCIELRLLRKSDDWLLEVQDSGVGIPIHAQSYIFDEFKQVDSSTQRQFGGSGLGLSIVRKLCNLMGGTVRVTSDLGKGSTFTAMLPIRTPETQALPDTALITA